MMRKENEFIKFINDAAQLCIKLIALSATLVTIMAWMWIGMMLLSAWFEVNAGTVWVGMTVMSVAAAIVVVLDRHICRRNRRKRGSDNGEAK